MKARTDAIVRGLGLLIGLAIALSAVLAWRLPPGEGTLGADLILVAGNTGELSVEPAGPFLSATRMHPSDGSDAASSDLQVFNKTAQDLDVRLRAVPSDADLNDVAWVAVDVRDRLVYRGPIGGLLEASDGSFSLGSGERRTLVVRAWVPLDAAGEHEGRIATVTIELETTVVER